MNATNIAARMVTHWKSIYPVIYARQPLIPWAEGFLIEVRRLIVTKRIVVATNTLAAMVLPKLEPLRQYLDEIVTADQGYAPKPDPTMLNFLMFDALFRILKIS